jgi:hypothetical protein
MKLLVKGKVKHLSASLIIEKKREGMQLSGEEANLYI